MYKVGFRKRAEKQLRKASEKDERLIRNQLKLFVENPFQKTNVEKMSGAINLYRLRVSRWRILYYLDNKNKTIEVIDIFMRKGKDYTKLFRALLELL